MYIKIREKTFVMLYFLSSATLATGSQWEVTDCTELNGYACKGPTGMDFSDIK